MKRLLTILLLIVSANVFGQVMPAPSGTLTSMTTNQGYLRLSDSTFYIYNGVNYKWQYLLTKSQADKLYAPLGTSGVTSFNTRTGAVSPLAGDYSSFYPLLNGTGATGTWGIGITGNSGTATTLATSRTIWGQSFNGSGNVSGALTGVTGITTTGGYNQTGSFTNTFSGGTTFKGGQITLENSNIDFYNSIGGHTSNLISGALAARSWTLPNASGTLALSSDLSSYVPTARTVTINGTTQDLSANRTWSVGTVTSITPAFGFTSATPITTSGTLVIDSTQVRSAANSLSLAQTQTALNLKEDLTNKATDFSVSNNTLYPTVQASKTYMDALVVGLLNDRGNYDASGNVYPSTGGSGASGTILKGNLWSITVSGTLGGVAVGIGDWVRALSDSPGQTASNWSIVEGNFGYVPENIANKATNLTSPDNTKYPTTLAVSNAITAAGGVNTMAAIGSVPNANGASISGTTLTLQPANNTHGGVLSNTNQSIKGVKTFVDRLYVGNAVGSLFASASDIEINSSAGYFTFHSGVTNSGFRLKTDLIQLSALRDFQFPNASGTIALTSDLTSGYLPLTGGTVANNIADYVLKITNTGGASAAYNGLDVNISTASIAKIINGSVAGVSKFSVDGLGALNVAGSGTFGGGLTISGTVSGYSGPEVTLNSGTGAQTAISTLGGGAQILNFDHRGTSNTGGFAWRNGTAAGTTLMTLSSTGSLAVGSTTATNLELRTNEVNARFNGVGSVLYLNYTNNGGIQTGTGAVNLAGALTGTSGSFNGRVFTTGNTNIGDLLSTEGALVMLFDPTVQEGYLSSYNYSTSTAKPLTINSSVVNLIGSLTGTSATFTGSVSSTGGSVFNAISSLGTVTTAMQSDNTAGYVGTLSNHPLRLRTNSTTVVTLGTDGLVTIGSGDVTGHPVPSNLQAIITNATASDHTVSGIFRGNQTTATSGSIQGVEGYVKASHTSGVVGLMIGAVGNAEVSGAGGGTTTVQPLRAGGIFTVNATVGGWSNIASIGPTLSGGGSINDYYGLYISAPVLSSGTITNKYALYGTSGSGNSLLGGGVLKASNNGTYYAATNLYHEIRTNLDNQAALVISNSADAGGGGGGYGVFITLPNTAPNNATNYLIQAADMSAARFYVMSNGGIHNYSANNVNLSDQRVKKNISKAGSYWDIIKAIEFDKYQYDKQNVSDKRKLLGVMAQQVEKVYPEWVSNEGSFGKAKDGTNLKSVYETQLQYGVNIVVQESMKRIEALEAKVKSLELKQ